MLISLFAYQLLNSRLENLQCANINIQQAFAQNLTSQLSETQLYSAVLDALSNDVQQTGAQVH